MAHQTFFKEPRSAKVVRGVRRRERKATEERAKRDVRARDKGCRFPLCGCRKFGLAVHVSHSRHKGMGGNPAGDRSVPELMIAVCSARHRENLVAIDRGTLRWEPLTAAGANGPVKWLVDADVLGLSPDAVWFEVARERTRGVLEPLNPEQRDMLQRLARMDV